MSHMAETSLKQIEAARRLAPEATACLRPVLETLYAHGQNASATGDDAAVQFGVDVTQKLVPVAAALAAKANGSFKSGAPSGAGPSGGAAPPEAAPNARGRGFTEDEILCSTAAPVSFASPRGKFVVHCLRDRFALESTTPKGTTTHVVRHEHVRRLLCLRRGDSNDTTDVVVALSPAAALAVGKQSVKTLLAQCRGKDKPVEIVTRRDMGLDPRLERGGDETRDAGEALVAMLEMASGIVAATRAEPLGGGKGFAGVGGRGCVKANVKFNQGFLFCLSDGFAFVDRPALWLPFDDVSDLKLARAEGVGSSFDVIVSLEPEKDGADGDRSPSRAGESFEFANISREELDGVRRYLAKNCSEKGEGEAGGKNAEGDDDDAFDARSDDDDDDDSDDEDFGVAQDLDEEESDDDDDSESGDDDDEEEEEASDSEEDSADGAGRKRARDDIPAATEPAAGEDPESASEEEEDDSDKVQLLTLHASKGLEFPHVFIMGLEEEILPHRSSIEEGNVEEERRLMYVGITRARETLTLTFAAQRKQYGEKLETIPSRFLDELPEDDLRWEGTGDLDVEANQQKGKATLSALLGDLGS